MPGEASGSAIGKRPSKGSVAAFVVAVLVLLAAHLALLSHFMPYDRMTGEVAISGFGDFATHISQAALFTEGMQKWGHTWVYDPFMIAGYPAGTIFDIDNKAWSIFVYLGSLLDVPIERSFGLYVLLAHLLVPVAVLFAAWAFELSPRAMLVALALGIGLWWFDSFVHWCWWAGMLAFTFAGYLFLVPLACFWRWSRSPGWGWAMACALSLGVLHLVHPFAFFACAPPMLILFGRKWSGLSRLERGQVFSIAAVVLLMNGWWLHNAFTFWHYLVDSSHYGQSRLAFLAADAAGLLLQPETTGDIGTRSLFRWAAWSLGVLGMWSWFREGDDRGSMLGGGWLFGFLLTYLGGYLSVSAQIQPYRYVMPISYLALIPAAHYLTEVLGELRARADGTRASRLVIALVFLVSLGLVRDGIYYLGRLLPKPIRTFDGRDSFYTADGYPQHESYHYGQFAPPDDLIDYVNANDDGQSRWLIDISFIGEEVAWRTHAQVIGGFPLRNLTHNWGNFFRRKPQGIAKPEELRAYMKTFGVGWVVVANPAHFLYRVPNPDLEFVAAVGFTKIFRFRDVPPLIDGGKTTPKVEAEVNMIKVSGSDPNADLLVRYHWFETLRCRPDCEIERAPSDELDPVGFMKIPAPHPADFEIYNSYEMP